MARSSRLVLIASQGGPLLSYCSYLDMSTVMCLVESFILWVFDVTDAKNIISNILLLTINSLTISQTGTFLPPANVVCEGYVFTGVCLSTGGPQCMLGDPPAREAPCQEDLPVRETPCQGEPPIRETPLPRRPPTPGRPPTRENPPCQGDLPGKETSPPGRPPARETPLPGRPPGKETPLPGRPPPPSPHPGEKLRGIRSRPTAKGKIEGDEI